MGPILRIILFLSVITNFGCSHRIWVNSRSVASEESCSKIAQHLFPLPNAPLASSLGMEFEGAIPQFIRYEEVALKVQNRIKKLYPLSAVTVERQIVPYSDPPYKVIWELDGVKREINILGDSSLQFEEKGLKGIEITSPVMRVNSDFDFFVDIIDELKVLNLKPRPDKGGIHFHNGIPEGTSYEDLIPLYEFFLKGSKLLLEVFHVNPERNVENNGVLVAMIAELRKLASEGRLVHNHVSYELNKRSIIRLTGHLKTFEIRAFNSSLDKEILSAYHHFNQRLFEKWRNDPDSLRKFVEEFNEDSREELYSFLNIDQKKFEASIDKALEERGQVFATNGLPSNPTAADYQIAKFFESKGSLSQFTSSLEWKKLSREEQDFALLSIINDSRFYAMSTRLRNDYLFSIKTYAQEHNLNLIRPYLLGALLFRFDIDDKILRNLSESQWHGFFMALSRLLKVDFQDATSRLASIMGGNTREFKRFASKLNYFLKHDGAKVENDLVGLFVKMVNQVDDSEKLIVMEPFLRRVQENVYRTTANTIKLGQNFKEKAYLLLNEEELSQKAFQVIIPFFNKFNIEDQDTRLLKLAFNHLVTSPNHDYFMRFLDFSRKQKNEFIAELDWKAFEGIIKVASENPDNMVRVNVKLHLLDLKKKVGDDSIEKMLAKYFQNP